MAARTLSLDKDPAATDEDRKAELR
jgi:hypothetical protein